MKLKIFFGNKKKAAVGFKIYVGANQVTKMYIGSTEVTTAYLGTKELK